MAYLASSSCPQPAAIADEFICLATSIDQAVLIIDAAQHIRFANPAFLALVDEDTADALVGECVSSWLPAFNMSASSSLAKRSDSNGRAALPQPVRARSGKTQRVTVSRGALPGERGEIIVVRSEDEIGRLKRRLKYKAALMHQTAAPCIIQDPAGCVQFVNRAFETMFGYSSTEAIGRIPRDFLTGPESNLAAMRTALETVRMGGSVKRDEALYRKDGSLIWIAYEQHAILDEFGEVSYIATTAIDISDRIEAERMKSDFVAMVGHELRTPLTVVAGAIDVLLDPQLMQLPPEAMPLAQAAQSNCRTLNTLIGDLLDINKIEAGLIDLHMEAVSPVQSLAIAFKSLKNKAEERAMAVHLPDEDESPFAHADPERLVQVLSNVLSNAIKYGREGGNIWVDVTATESHVLISIRDDGAGIDTDMRDRIFEKFSRAPDVTAQGIEGFGLGLSICRSLVVQMGGTIDLDPEISDGTCFRVRLSRATDPTHEPAAGKHASSSETLLA